VDDDARTRLHEAATLIRDAAARISGAWSARVPASLEISDEDYAVLLRANPGIAPQARAFELGIRHPLWATGGRSGWKWGPTPHRPFLELAVDEQGDAAVHKVALVVDDWCHKLGYDK
jgi:hypothetical protein